MIKLVLVNITKDTECPPLNLAYLATYLKKQLKDKIKIKVVDINFENPLEKILQLKPDIIGISSMTVRYNYANKLAKQVKRNLKVPIIIGGVHVSTCPESFSEFFDIGIAGEGEETTLELMKLFIKHKSFSPKYLQNIKGIIFWQNGKILKTEKRGLIDLDKLPIPNRKFLDKRYFLPKVSYNKIRGKRVIEAGMLTSRGCPYRCVFCSTSLFWNRVRFHSSERVAKEIGYLTKEFGVNYIVMYDDFFAITEERAQSIYDAMKKLGLIGRVNIACSLRANVVTDNLCRILKDMGVVTVNFGFESGSDRILRYLKAESVTVEQNKKAVILCRKYGFDVTGSFIVGSPGEKIEDMRKTLELIKWMNKQGAIELWCGVAKPYPSTQLWNYGVKNKIIDKNFKWDLVDPSYIHNPVFLDKSISKKEFFRIFKEIKRQSFNTSLCKKENSLLRELKDIFYYNTFLNNIGRATIRALPRPATRLIAKALKTDESSLGID